MITGLIVASTAERLGVDASGPQHILEVGARELAMRYARFRSWRLALAASNTGPQAVEKYRGISPFAETEGYVTAILG